MTTLAIIHTATATVEPLKALAAEVLPGAEVINLVDDSILPQLARNGGDLADVTDRLVAYARIAESLGVDIILEACSSVGEVVTEMRSATHIPVLRIDDAMAACAVERGTRIAVIATLPTTLGPTQRLIAEKAKVCSKSVVITPHLAGDAFWKLAAGDRDGHDADLADLVSRVAETADVVVLAQASMARAVPRLSPDVQSKVLTSPRLGMDAVRATLERSGAIRESSL